MRLCKSRLSSLLCREREAHRFGLPDDFHHVYLFLPLFAVIDVC